MRPSTGVRARILLAEDNPVNEKVATHTLRRLGYEVHAVGNGQAAVEAWRSGGFDLILMDCQMPVLDGYEATGQIRQLEAGERRIPIVALTANAMKDDDLRCQQAGMDFYLTKPLDRERLRSCLEQCLARAEAGAANLAARAGPRPGYRFQCYRHFAHRAALGSSNICVVSTRSNTKDTMTAMTMVSACTTA